MAYGPRTRSYETAGLMRGVSDSDTIRRLNRGLVLDAIRRIGPLPRTHLARETGLSHATITAITSDMIGQSILVDLQAVTTDRKARGRPSVRVGFNRGAGYVLLFEIDVNKARCSLVDYGGTLVDRIEAPLTPTSFDQVSPVDFLVEQAIQMQRRNQAEAPRIVRVAASVQGILDHDRKSLKWSPVADLAGRDLVEGMQNRLQLPMILFKRGLLLAEGVRWLFPEVKDSNVATVFVGSTVGMGMSFHGRNIGRGEEAATEFGHMNHIPNGALCRCGMLGCIEAYAADYGVLRTAYGVPDKTPPAPAVPANQYAALITRAQQGDRNVTHAFNLAGAAIGFGLNRLMTVFGSSHLMIMGPGAAAFPFMRSALEAALAASLIAHVHGAPRIMTHDDESEPISKGLMMKALIDLDQTDFAAMPSVHAGAAGR